MNLKKLSGLVKIRDNYVMMTKEEIERIIQLDKPFIDLRLPVHNNLTFINKFSRL